MLTILLAATLTHAAPVAPVDPAATTWRLDHIFADVATFEAERKAVEGELDGLRACEGTLDRGAAHLADCLDGIYSLQQRAARLYSYAANHASADTRDADWQAREASIQILFSRFGQATSWFDPELSALGSDTVEGWIAAEPRLAPYAYGLRSTLRRAEHVLSPAEERLLALASPLTHSASNSRSQLVNADLPWPTFTLPDGTDTTLSPAEFSRLRTIDDRAARRQVFDSFFGAFQTYESSLGTLLSGQVSAHWFMAQARGYESSVQARLASEFLPREIYETLVAQTNKNLPTLHRYLTLRARMMGVQDLGYHDLYMPLVQSDLTFDLGRSKAISLAAAKPLGKDYQRAMAAGFDGGWMDVYPRPGKRGGAYMSDSAYGTHPFVLLNHTDDYNSASTLAHEWGHAMHSHYASGAQPYPTANYATFVAEIASTFNEALLLDYMLDQAKTDDERLFYLGNALEGLRTTYFRQAMFGEFELAIHDKVEQGEPLTGAELTRMYGELVRRYHGHDQGIVQVDDVWTLEWAYVPHFYYDFYVWQYATSLAASSQLADTVMQGGKKERERYLDLLRAGGSDDPHKLLLAAGVDMTRPEPYDAVAERMNRIMDEIEAILKKQGK